MKIAILGGGAFGTALGGILADNGYDIDYYDPKIDPENLNKVLLDAKLILLATPSSTAPHLLPYLPKQIPLIIATKGFLTTDSFAEFKDFMIISGPGFANDIKNGKEIKFTITDPRLADIFKANFINFDQTTDKDGVLMCGALKNIYAILAGFLNLKKDTTAWQDFISQVIKEMKEILSLNGADPKTVDLACGVSDLKLTCDTPSRNYQYGQLLCQNSSAKPDKTVEGYTALGKIKRGEIKIPDTATRLLELMETLCH